MISLTTNTTISIRDNMISWSGVVLPRTTPNDIRTAAAAKSLKSMLKFEQI